MKKESKMQRIYSKIKRKKELNAKKFNKREKSEYKNIIK